MSPGGAAIPTKGDTTVRKIALTLSAIGLTAIAASGCSNALEQPLPGETPTAAAAPGPNAAGGPLVAANYANASRTISPNPAVEPVRVTPINPNATLQKQETSGYFPYADAPLIPPTPNVK
jgi:hypothetical protein